MREETRVFCIYFKLSTYCFEGFVLDAGDTHLFPPDFIRPQLIASEARQNILSNHGTRKKRKSFGGHIGNPCQHLPSYNIYQTFPFKCRSHPLLKRHSLNQARISGDSSSFHQVWMRLFMVQGPMNQKDKLPTLFLPYQTNMQFWSRNKVTIVNYSHLEKIRTKNIVVAGLQQL